MNNLITCPKCNHEFEPAIGYKKAMEAEIEQAVQSKLKQREAEKLAELESKFLADITKREQVLADMMKEKEAEFAEVKKLLLEKDEAVKSANEAHAKVLQEQRNLDADKARLELTIQQRVNGELPTLREQIAEGYRQEYEVVIAGLRLKNEQLEASAEKLRNQAKQGSQQNQGEALEIVLEDALRREFVCDEIEPILTGGSKRGADVLQRVDAKLNREAGTIIWESKNTQNWGNDWCAKAKDDQVRERASIAVISSVSLPKSIKNFGILDGVWVCAPQYAIPLAVALRSQLSELARIQNLEGNRSRVADQIYDYLIGNEFRSLVENAVSAFDTMRADIDREKRTAHKNFAKREKQLATVVESITCLYSQLHGISGEAIAQVKGLEFDDEIENSVDIEE